MKIIKNITLSIVLLFTAVFTPLIVTGSALALFEGAKDQACRGTNLDTADCTVGQGETEVNKTLSTVINLLSLIVGIIAVIMLLVGGIKFITSGGDSSATSAARNTILYALVGLVVAALAQGIVKFVLGRAT